MSVLLIGIIIGGMKKPPFLFFILLLFVTSCFGQAVYTRPVTAQQRKTTEPCTLTLKDAPALRDLRLGMTAAEAAKALEIASLLSKGLQNEERELNLISYSVPGSNSPKLKGALFFELRFLDDKLYKILANYDASVHWESARVFVAEVSNKLKLPSAWVWEEDQAQMTCNGFTIKAQIKYLEMTDIEAEKELAKRRAELEKAKQREFKP